jgi:hypothetical protein
MRQLDRRARDCMERVIMFNATFNNISVISWLSVLLAEDTGVPGENQPTTRRKSLTNLMSSRSYSS